MHACYSKAVNTDKPRPGILLDRDGTIISDHGYVGQPERVQLIPGAAEAIASFNAAGIPVAIVTNQGGVAYGYYTIDDVEAVHEYLARKLAEYGAQIDFIAYCPYHPNGNVPAFTRMSQDRKPRPGMAYAAAEKLGLDLSLSVMVGDRPEDVGLADSIGAEAIYVGHGPCPSAHAVTFPDLAAAAPYILERLDT